MRKNIVLPLSFAVVCAALLPHLPVRAQTPSPYALPILRISPYARQVAMGEAFTALANDINVMRYNVGGLGNLRNILLSVHYHKWIEDTQQGALEAALPTRYGVLGMNFTYFDEGEIIELDDNFTPTGNVLGSHDLIFALGYGSYVNLFKNTLSFGAALKLIRQDLVSESGSGVGLDLGLLYSLKHFSVGATLQNLTVSKISLGNGAGAYLLPETMRGGVAARLPVGESFKWNVGVDAAKHLDNADKDVRLYAGTEFRVSEVFALRGGYKFHDSEISRWGAGFGVIIPMSWLGGSSTAFDYAYSPLEDFDSQAHRFSVSFNFGTITPQPLLAAGDVQNELEAARRARRDAEEARLAAMEAEGRLREVEGRMSDLEKLLNERLEAVRKIAETTQGAIEVTEDTKRNVLTTLRVNFDFDKSDIRPDMFEILDKLADILNTYPESQVWISGHTDNIGDDEYNFHLAQRRMTSVMKYLTRVGLDARRFIDPIPYGEWRPLTDNRTPAERFRNRRVEFLIYTGDNKPEPHPGSMIENVLVQNDTISIAGNGELTFTRTFVDNPPRLVLKFPKVYIPDPRTVAINRGGIQQARLGFHPEDGSTWVVLDMTTAVSPELIAAGRNVNVITSTIAERRP